MEAVNTFVIPAFLCSVLKELDFNAFHFEKCTKRIKKNFKCQVKGYAMTVK